MAFEKINDYTDFLKTEYEGTDDYDKQVVLLSCATAFYETVLKTAKFKGQREYMKQTIKYLNPAFFRGYFRDVK